MRRVGAGPMVALAMALGGAPEAGATYAHARAVGKRCSTCHETTRPDVANLNRAGLFFMAHRRLEGEAGTAPGQAAPPRAAAGRAPTPPSPRPRADAGAEVFARNCALCHGARGEGTERGVSLVAGGKHGDGARAIAAVVEKGVPGTAMFAFGDVLSALDIRAVAAYVASLKDR